MPDDEKAPGDEAIEDQLQQARRALADAEGAHNAELSDVVVINRLYYACFHAAQGVLYDRGYTPNGYGTLDVDVDALLRRTETFVTEMEALCSAK